MYFTIPETDQADFFQLPSVVRQSVQDMLECMKYIYNSPAKTKACKELAAQRGKHHNSFYNAWNKFKKIGWRALIDRRLCSEMWKSETPKGLPKDFLSYWRKLAELNQRSSRAAHAQLITQWRRWQAGDVNATIPGYEICPQPKGSSSYPRGWSYDNLMKHMSSDVQLAAMREGREAAKALAPAVFTSTANMYPFQEIEFDDMWHDFEVMVPGHAQPCRMIEFGSIDVRTGYIFRPAVKPRIRSLDTKKTEQLNEREFRLYLVNFLRSVGYHPDGTTLRTEKGTASLRITSKEGKKFVDKLNLYTNGKVTIVEPGMTGAASHVGAYAERAKGNFRCKARKEGIHKLIHNTLASLPGQVGMSADRLPAEYHGRAREHQLLQDAASLNPALAENLQMPFMDLHTAVSAINQANDQINRRTNHEIADWENYTVSEYRITETVDQWISTNEWEAMETVQRDLIISMSRNNENLARHRRMSPTEVISQHSSCLVKISLAAVANLLARDLAKERTIKNGLITFEDSELGAGKHRFHAVLKEESGLTRQLANGETFTTVVNPFEPDLMMLMDKDGRYLGTLKRWHSVDRTDADAIKHQIGRAQGHLSDALADLGVQHGHDRLRRLKTNTQTIRDTVAAPTEKQKARALQLETADLDDDDFIAPMTFEEPEPQPIHDELDSSDLL